MTRHAPDAGLPRRPRQYGAMPVARIVTLTFGGAWSGPELLTSISEQRGAIVNGWIRDAGSTDLTREMLAGTKSHMDVHVLTGANRGELSSLLELPQTCLKDGDFYVFRDPHDVWLRMLGFCALLAAALHPSRVPLERTESVDQTPVLLGLVVALRKPKESRALQCRR
jgi:hypothetical protein